MRAGCSGSGSCASGGAALGTGCRWCSGYSRLSTQSTPRVLRAPWGTRGYSGALWGALGYSRVPPCTPILPVSTHEYSVEGSAGSGLYIVITTRAAKKSGNGLYLVILITRAATKIDICPSCICTSCRYEHTHELPAAVGNFRRLPETSGHFRRLRRTSAYAPTRRASSFSCGGVAPSP